MCSLLKITYLCRCKAENMSYRLTRSELRIIEESKREGEEFHEALKKAEAGKNRKSRAALWSAVVFITIFVLLAFAVKVLFGWLAQ